MKNHYNRREWRTFRKDMIRLHEGTCNRCERGEHDGVILQVHHKTYIAGRLPWQYRPDECEVLCRGCHAEEHGKIMPKSGWEHFGDYDDLGDLDGECELCGTSIRYVFPVHHEKWGTIEVGETCCDHLTSTTFATDHMASHRKRIDRRKRFVCSSRWHTNKSGSPRIVQDHVVLCVVRDGAKYRLQMDGTTGKLEFGSVLEAKIKAFDLIGSPAVRAFLQKQKRRTIIRNVVRSNSPWDEHFSRPSPDERSDIRGVVHPRISLRSCGLLAARGVRPLGGGAARGRGTISSGDMNSLRAMGRFYCDALSMRSAGGTTEAPKGKEAT